MRGIEGIQVVRYTGEVLGREEQCMGMLERERQVNMRKKGGRTYERI